MSIHALSWALNRKAGSTNLKATLTVLADRANDHGVLYAGLDWLADRLECSRSTASTNLNKLEERGLVLRVRRHDGSGQAKSSLTVLAPHGDRGHMLPFVEDDEFGPLIREALERPSKANFKKAKVGDSNVGDPNVGDPDPIQSELPLHTVSSSQTVTTALSETASVSPEEADIMTVFEKWLSIAGPKNRELTPSRRRVIVKAIKEQPVSVCCDALDGLVEWNKQRPLKSGDGLALSRALATNMKSPRPLGEQIEFFASLKPAGSATKESELAFLPGIPEDWPAEVRKNAQRAFDDLVKQATIALDENQLVGTRFELLQNPTSRLAVRGLRPLWRDRLPVGVEVVEDPAAWRNELAECARTRTAPEEKAA